LIDSVGSGSSPLVDHLIPVEQHYHSLRVNSTDDLPLDGISVLEIVKYYNRVDEAQPSHQLRAMLKQIQEQRREIIIMGVVTPKNWTGMIVQVESV